MDKIIMIIQNNMDKCLSNILTEMDTQSINCDNISLDIEIIIKDSEISNTSNINIYI